MAKTLTPVNVNRKRPRRANARLAARVKAFDETNNGYRGVRRPGSLKMRTN